MQKINNWNEVEATGNYESPSAGGYVATLVNVEDVADKQYLKVEFDITEGEFRGYAASTYERAGFWPLTMYRSYKPGCEGMFKAFTNAVEASNDGYAWDFDESTLEGLDIGVVLQCEHYVKNNGDLGSRLVAQKVCSVKDIKDGKFMVPTDKWTDDAKALAGAKEALGFDTMEQADADNPFA